MSKFCIHCGMENAGQAVFCTRCHNSLSDAVLAEPPPTKPIQPFGKAASSYLLPVVLGGLVLILYFWFSWAQVGWDGYDGIHLQGWSGSDMSWYALRHSFGFAVFSLYLVPIYAMTVIASSFLFKFKNADMPARNFKILTCIGVSVLVLAFYDVWSFPLKYVYADDYGYPRHYAVGAYFDIWFCVEILTILASAGSVLLLKDPDSLKAGVAKKSPEIPGGQIHE